MNVGTVTYTASCHDCYVTAFGIAFRRHDNGIEGPSTLCYFLIVVGPSHNGEEVAAGAERHHRDTGHRVRFTREEERVIGDGELPPGLPEVVVYSQIAPQAVASARRWWKRRS